MRRGFDQFCPDCFFARHVNKIFGNCYCEKFRAAVSRKHFPPQVMKSQRPDHCDYFKKGRH